MDRMPKEQLDKIMELSIDNLEAPGSSIFIRALSDLMCCIEVLDIKKDEDLESTTIAGLTAHMGRATYTFIVPILTALCYLLKQNSDLTTQIATLTARIARLEGVENAN